MLFVCPPTIKKTPCRSLFPYTKIRSLSLFLVLLFLSVVRCNPYLFLFHCPILEPHMSSVQEHPTWSGAFFGSFQSLRGHFPVFSCNVVQPTFCPLPWPRRNGLPREFPLPRSSKRFQYLYHPSSFPIPYCRVHFKRQRSCVLLEPFRHYLSLKDLFFLSHPLWMAPFVFPVLIAWENPLLFLEHFSLEFGLVWLAWKLRC